jgi:hypothetical protein
MRYWKRCIANATTCEERPRKIKLIKFPRDPLLDQCAAYVPGELKIFREEASAQMGRTLAVQG